MPAGQGVSEIQNNVLRALPLTSGHRRSHSHQADGSILHEHIARKQFHTANESKIHAASTDRNLPREIRIFDRLGQSKKGISFGKCLRSADAIMALLLSHKCRLLESLSIRRLYVRAPSTRLLMNCTEFKVLSRGPVEGCWM